MMQTVVGVRPRARTDERTARPPLSVCALTRDGSARLATVLELLWPHVAEIVVALDDRAQGGAARLAAVADEVLVFPHCDPSDSVIPWLHARCGGGWILNVDDDEVPSVGLLARLPELIAADVTHWWLPRRWLVRNVETFLDEPPWLPDYQLRLYRNDSATLRFSDEFHRPVIVSGPAGFARDPLWHLDCVVNPFERRRQKALAYEHARRGMRIAGYAHNSGLYLPELRPEAKTAAVPEADVRLIRTVLAEPVPARRVSRATVRRAAREEIDALWPGEPYDPTLYAATLTRLGSLEQLIAGAEHTVAVVVENRSSTTWQFGAEAVPLIQVGTRWVHEGGVEPGIHTPLPADLRPGGELVVPVHVRAPLHPGRHRLVVDLVHEHVRWFDSPIEWTVEVIPRRRIALVGRGETLDEALDDILVDPQVEPVLLDRDETAKPERFGHERAPGPGGYLLAGLDGRIQLAELARLAARTTRLLRRARRLRAGKPSAPLPREAEACLAALATCERLWISGVDWGPRAAPTRELWRLAATTAAARRLGLRVVVEPGALPPQAGTVDRLLARLIGGS
jgi:hypothetical protein